MDDKRDLNKISIDSALNGFRAYIEDEIASQFSDFKKIALPFAVGLYLPVLKQKFLDSKAMLKAMQVVDDDDLIDISKLGNEAKRILKKQGSFTQNIPFLNVEFTFEESDIDKFVNKLKGI